MYLKNELGELTSRLSFTCIFCLFVAANSNIAYSDVKFVEQNLLKPEFSGNLEEISNFGSFLLEDQGTFRLWGLSIKIERIPELREELLGRKIICVSAGETFVGTPRTSVVRKVSYCTFGDTHPINTRGLSSMLLERGFAKELCEESYNWFKRCIN